MKQDCKQKKGLKTKGDVMKKLFLIGASLFSILGGSSLFAACGSGACGAL